MKSLNTQKGFTLVELAIVMTIIGLLIGGILKGQELMDNARVSATVAQEKGFEAATTTFRDTYNSFPGDVPNADSRIPGCDGAKFLCAVKAATAGDYLIGANTWADATTWQGTAGGMAPAAAGVAQVDEPEMYWMHLLQANLITGVTNAPIQATTPLAFGITHPEAKMGGGFIVGYANGTIGKGSPMPAGTGVAGTVLMIVPSLGTGVTNTSAVQAMTPSRAAQIDRKLDDGKPGSGLVQAYGVQASCWKDAATNAYQENITLKDCGLILRIQS